MFKEKVQHSDYSETHHRYLIRKTTFFLNLIHVHKHEWKYMNRTAIKTNKCHSKYRYAISQSTFQI